ncbi:MAG: DNA mismatch repair protein MutS, partial [Alphaproteobacteria bacterium]
VMEYLHDVKKCRTLFATHYHELTGLQEKLDKMSCRTVRVKEWQDKIVFLHEVIAGAADRSYGIHVGKLAGLPADVVKRAEDVLRVLESGEQAGILDHIAEHLPIFKPADTSVEQDIDPELGELLDVIDQVKPDELTPREALDILYKISELRQRRG